MGEGRETRRKGEVKEQIMRVLLNYPNGELSKYRVWKLSEGSQTWVYDFINQLEKEGYLKNIKVVDIRGLFELWRKNIGKTVDKYYLVKNSMQLLESVEKDYALTTYRAENLVQNYLFPSRTDVYCRIEDQGYWHDLLSKKGVIGGGNFRIRYGSKHVFFNSFSVNNYKVVSKPQLIVDLLMEGGPCIDAADMLIDKLVARDV
jgi:hypothetical protein